MNMPYMNGLKLAQSIRKMDSTRLYKIILISAEEYDNLDNV